jgi:hypothetical protein
VIRTMRDDAVVRRGSMRALALILSLCPFADTPPVATLVLSRGGNPTLFSDDRSEPIVGAVLTLFRQTGATSHPEIATLSAWQIRAQGTFLHLTWTRPQQIEVRHFEQIEATELLVPLNNSGRSQSTIPWHLVNWFAGRNWSARNTPSSASGITSMSDLYTSDA